MDIVGNLIKYGVVGGLAVGVKMLAGGMLGQYGVVGDIATVVTVAVGGTIASELHWA